MFAWRIADQFPIEFAKSRWIKFAAFFRPSSDFTKHWHSRYMTFWTKNTLVMVCQIPFVNITMMITSSSHILPYLTLSHCILHPIPESLMTHVSLLPEMENNSSHIPTSRNPSFFVDSTIPWALSPRFYRLRVAPLVDVGLLLCSLVCIDQAMELDKRQRMGAGYSGETHRTKRMSPHIIEYSIPYYDVYDSEEWSVSNRYV